MAIGAIAIEANGALRALRQSTGAWYSGAMLLLATLTALATAVAPAAPDHLKVLVLDVNSTDLTESEKTTLTNLLAAHLGDYSGLEVLSGEDLKQLVALQGQAQELGVTGHCTDACMAELAGALGAGVVIATQAGKLGNTLVVTLAIFDAAKARSVSRKSITASSLGELPDKLGPALDALVRPLLPESVRMNIPAPMSSTPTSSPPAPAAPSPTPAVQTRVVDASATSATSAKTALAQAPAPQPAAPAAPAEAAASDDGTVWLIVGVVLAVVGAVVVVLVVSDPNAFK